MTTEMYALQLCCSKPHPLCELELVSPFRHCSGKNTVSRLFLPVHLSCRFSGDTLRLYGKSLLPVCWVQNMVADYWPSVHVWGLYMYGVTSFHKTTTIILSGSVTKIASQTYSTENCVWPQAWVSHHNSAFSTRDLLLLNNLYPNSGRNRSCSPESPP